MPDFRTVQNWSRDEAHQFQDEQISRFISDVIYPHHTYYRNLFDREQLDPSDIRSRDDLRQLPLTSKQDLLSTDEHPQKHRDFIIQPDSDYLRSLWSTRLKALWKGRETVQRELEREFRPIFLTATTGRSSDPVAFLYTDYDIQNIKTAGDRLIRVSGGTSEMKGLNFFPYAPHLAFWQVIFSQLEHGMLVVSTGGGKVRGTDESLALMKKMKPDVIIGIPSFVYHLLREANEQMMDLSYVQKIILGGEGISTEGRHSLIERVQEGGGDKVDILPTYGFTEAKMAWPECPGTPGEPTGYHYYPDLTLFECIDPESGEPVSHEEGGEVVFTPIDARGSVVLRYRTGDICESIQWGSCPECGRNLPRIMGPIQRVSKIQNLRLDKVKGTLVNFNALQSLLTDHDLLEEWQVELRKRNDDPLEVDELHVHVAPRDEVNQGMLTDVLSQDIRSETEVTPDQIHVHDYQSMLDRIGMETELKETRFLDNRPQGTET